MKKNEASLDSLVRYAKSMGMDLSVELVGIQENTVKYCKRRKVGRKHIDN